ncbi:MAG TPA: hypothetical protein VFC00_04865 [Micromonosporaceae bacterium]|nr:hypothetical protein [Micromonosporaceae bacterium]
MHTGFSVPGTGALTERSDVAGEGRIAGDGYEHGSLASGLHATMSEWSDVSEERVHGSNDQLRQARELLPSQRTPGECMSRQELAELVNEWVFYHGGERVELDHNYVGKLERGVIRWPRRLYRQAFRAVLHVETDAQLGFYTQRRRSGTVRPVDRQQFLRASGAVLALPWMELFAPSKPTLVPTKVGVADVEAVRDAVAALTTLNDTYGGGFAREAAFAQLRWSAQLLRADCPEGLRPDLFAAIASLAGAAGFMAADVDAYEDSRRAYRFGLACAEQSGNWRMQAWILGDMALQAIWSGRPDDGLTFADMALVRADRLTATERARLHTVRARVLAKLPGRAQDALAAVGAGDDEFAHATSTELSRWYGPHDHVWHHALTGHALLDLSIAGKRTQAGRRLTYAVSHNKQGYARLRAISRTKNATLLMATGDPREAAVIGHRALDEAGILRSRRVVDDLRELQRFAGRHSQIAEVAELRGRIAEVIDAN